MWATFNIKTPVYSSHLTSQHFHYFFFFYSLLFFIELLALIHLLEFYVIWE